MSINKAQSLELPESQEDSYGFVSCQMAAVIDEFFPNSACKLSLIHDAHPNSEEVMEYETWCRSNSYVLQEYLLSLPCVFAEEGNEIKLLKQIKSHLAIYHRYHCWSLVLYNKYRKPFATGHDFITKTEERGVVLL